MATQHDVRLAPSHYIDNFIQEELDGVKEEETDLLAFVHDHGRTYLLSGSCVVDVTYAELTLAPRTFSSSLRKGEVANVWWGNRRRFNGKKAMELYHQWEVQEPKAVLTNTGRLYELDGGKHAAVFEASILGDAGETQYVLLARRFLWLVVRDLDELEHCTVELLPTHQVRIRVGDRVLGMVMPLSKKDRVLSTDADLKEEEEAPALASVEG